MTAERINQISGAIVDAAMKVHTALGPGLLESAYEGCLKHELIRRGLKILSQVTLPITLSASGGATAEGAEERRGW